jgi:hypothetical protein
MGAQISAVAGLCAHLSGPRAKAIHQHFMETGVRVEAGDKALYSVIEQNCDRVDRAAAEGDVLAVALQNKRVEKTSAEDVHDLPWAKDWNTTRSIQLHSNKEVIAGCHEHSHNSPTIQNLLNQGAIGFTCSTKRFKQDNGIPQSAPVADYMIRDQINLRHMGQQKYSADVGTLTPAEGAKRMREIRDKSIEFAEFMGFGGLRKRPARASFANTAVKIEARHEKKTQRQLKIVLKQRAADQDAREISGSLHRGEKNIGY